MPTITIDLQDPDTLLFDETPDLFVLLNIDPVIFSVRGLRHFTPRFKAIGIDIASVRTEAQFRYALMTWTSHETTLLAASIESKARSTHQPNEHQVLLAAIMGDIDAAESAMDRLEHSKRACLAVVRTVGPTE